MPVDVAMSEIEGTLPNYVFVVLNSKSSGHDTGVAYASKWYQKNFEPLVTDQKFMESTILITTFDFSLFFLLIVLIATSRIYLGVHYLSDVAAGIIAGIAWGTLVVVAKLFFKHWRP